MTDDRFTPDPPTPDPATESAPVPATDPAPGRAAPGALGLGVALALTVGQLWALSVAANAWLAGDGETAWWTAAFSAVCFLLVLALWRFATRPDC
ncbi:DUF6755 family protein [Kitasatospora sp. LaBMicrA B282]|uniref:DUF6755 family protein n=1 Tax=Kitasatospora sp. LaBMicrA B282 TaxID=3420949 RepID=UPI003D0EA018